MDPILVITSSTDGAGDQRFDSALAIMRAHTSIEIAPTAGPGELDGVLHRAGSRRIAVAGNDRTLHAVVSALYRRHELSGRVIGLLPAGTGTNFARRHGIPTDLEDAARVVACGRPRPVDLVVDELGGVVVDQVSIDASPPAQAPSGSWLSRLGEVGIGGVTLAGLTGPLTRAVTSAMPRYLRLRIEVDGAVVVDVDRAVTEVSIASTWAPAAAEPADTLEGELEVSLLPEGDQVSPLIRAGTWAGRKTGLLPIAAEHRRLRGSTVRISGQEFWCHPDGESYGPERQRTWRVEPSAYCLLHTATGN